MHSGHPGVRNELLWNPRRALPSLLPLKKGGRGKLPVSLSLSKTRTGVFGRKCSFCRSPHHDMVRSKGGLTSARLCSVWRWKAAFAWARRRRHMVLQLAPSCRYPPFVAKGPVRHAMSGRWCSDSVSPTRRRELGERRQVNQPRWPCVSLEF